MAAEVEMTSSNQRIAKNAIFLYIRLAIIMVVNLYITRVVIAALGVDDYGVYSVVCGFVAMIGFLGTSMSSGIQRFYNYELGKTGNDGVFKVFNIALIQQLGIVRILVPALLIVGTWYLNNVMVISEPRLMAANYVFIFSVISLVLVIVQTPYNAAVIAYERMDFFALVSIIETFAKLGVAYGIKCVPEDKVDKLVLYGCLLMTVQLLSFVAYFSYCKCNFSHLKFKIYFEKGLFKSMLLFSGWNLLGSFAFMISSQGINMLLNYFFGTVANAANGVASQVSHAVQTFSINIMLAFQPQIVQSYAVKKYKRVEQLMFNMTKMSYILLSILAIPVVIEIDYILNLWLENNDPEFLHYTKLFIILTSVIMGLGLFHTSITKIFHATGKIMLFQIITCVVVCAILPVSWLFLKNESSPESVYIVTIVAYFINWMICLYLLRRIFEFNVGKYATMVIACILLTIVSLLLAFYVHSIMQESFMRLICVFAVVFVTQILGGIATLSKQERQKVVMMCRQKLAK